MALHRRAAKRDASEPEIIEALEKCGWSVLQISVTDGPDLIVAKMNYDCGMCLGKRTIALEVKTGKAKLKPGQKDWFDAWPGEKAVMRSAEDVVNL